MTQSRRMPELNSEKEVYAVVNVHTACLPSPRFSTATHLDATRQRADAIGVGSNKYRSGYHCFNALVAATAL